MKINREQLIELLKDNTKPELSLSELIEITEVMPTLPRKNLTKEPKRVAYGKTVEWETEVVSATPSKNNVHKGTVSFIGGASLENTPDNIEEWETENAPDNLPDYVQDLLDNGHIRDLKYAQVLAGNKSYMKYLVENPTLLLEKRIEWKINKLVGLTSYNVVAKDLYLGNIPDVVESESVRDLESLLLERMHIPKERLLNIPLVDLIYLLDAYGIDKLKVLFFLIRSNGSTPSHLTTVNYKTYSLLSLRNALLEEIEPILDDIKAELEKQLDNTLNLPLYMVPSINSIFRLLNINNLYSELGKPQKAVIGNLIDPLAHTYRERRVLNKYLSNLYRQEIFLDGRDELRFKALYNLVYRLSSLYNSGFPYEKQLEDLLIDSTDLKVAYNNVLDAIERRLEELA